MIAPPASDRELAERLGLARRTIYKLRKRGAPAGLDEAAWRTWCAHQFPEVRCTPPLDAGLADLLAPQASSPSPTPAAPGAVPEAPAAPTEAAGGTAKDKDPEELTPSAQVAQATVALRNEQVLKARLEREILERLHVHRDEVRTLLGAQALLIVGELTALPAHVAAACADLPVEHRAQVRRAIDAAILALRHRITETGRERLAACLAPRS